MAVGGLTTSGEIDIGFMKELRKNTADKVLVMHRAFDQLSDQASGLEQLIDIGVDRVLTSGGAPTAEVGMEQLRRLIVQSRGRIEILPGAGIRLNNAHAILQGTGCNQLHGTFKKVVGGKLKPDSDAIAQLRKLASSTD